MAGRDNMTESGRFVDSWDRADGPLNNGWRSTHEDAPAWWDPLELRGGSPVNICPDPGPIASPTGSGARATAYRDFGTNFCNHFCISVLWNGNHKAPGFPVACINRNHPDFGLAFCYEAEFMGGAYVLWALGRQPDEIRILAGAKGGDHTDSTPMWHRMRIENDRVTCFADDKEILSSSIPEALRGSSIHGFGLDVNPMEGRPANVPVLGAPFVIELL
jgi:hypothetical protein